MKEILEQALNTASLKALGDPGDYIENLSTRADKIVKELVRLGYLPQNITFRLEEKDGNIVTILGLEEK